MELDEDDDEVELDDEPADCAGAAPPEVDDDEVVDGVDDEVDGLDDSDVEEVDFDFDAALLSVR